MSLQLQTTAATEVENDAAWQEAALRAERLWAHRLMVKLHLNYRAVPEDWHDELKHYAMTDMLIEKVEQSLESLRATGERTGRLRRVKALLETIEKFRADAEMNPMTVQAWQARASQIQSTALEAATAIRQSLES